jgi:hypothetical protein
MNAKIPANHIRPQNLPAKPVVEIVYGQNFATVFWKQPPFSETSDVVFGTDKEHLKALGETRSGLWQFPYAELDPTKEYSIRVQAKNKAGLGPWSDLKTLRVPTLKTAPTVDTKGKPASVATPNWFVQSWGKIRQSKWLPLIIIWLIIIGLIFAAITLTLGHKKIPSSIVKAPTVAETPNVSVPPMADVSTARVNRDEKLATAARGGIAMVDSIMININQAAPSPVVNTTEILPDRVPTQLPEPSPEMGSVDVPVCINPGYQGYQTFVVPAGCSVDGYPEIGGVILDYYDGKRPANCPRYNGRIVTGNYGYLNTSPRSVRMTIRVSRQRRLR